MTFNDTHKSLFFSFPNFAAMDLGQKPKLTKQQRIDQRWNRVQQRLAVKLAAQNGDDGNNKDSLNNDDDIVQSQTKLQIKKSRDIVDDSMQSILNNVSDIKLSSEMKASQRRNKCENEYESRMYRLEQTIEKGRELNTEIDNEWNNLHSIKNPQSLYKGIQETKLKCKQLIMGYESTRKQFMSEFKKKSEHYVNLLKSQESDITEMIWRMHDGIKRIKDEYEMQIIEVEKSFMKERREIIESNQNILDQLFDRRTKQEFLILERKIMSQNKYHEDLEKVRREDQESYNKLKINLENHIQLLEQQLEEMRAMYQLNTEKLNYNFQVLKEREKENITTVDHLKRREKKLKESVTNMKEKFNIIDKKSREEYKILNDEYNRISKQYKELQRKFKHFQQTDTQKYDEICDMNRKEAIDLLEQIMKCDQIISTQLLGIEWNPTQWKIPQTVSKELSQTLHNEFHTNREHQFTAMPTLSYSSIGSPLKSRENIHEDANTKTIDTDDMVRDNKENETISSDVNASNSSTSKESGEVLTNFTSQKYTTEEIMNVMKLLMTEAPFLISSAVKESLHSIPMDKQLLFQCESILKSLGIEDIEDLEELISLFIKDNKISIEPYQTIQIVKKYVSNRNHTKATDIHTSNFSVKHALTSASREKQERRKRKDQEYWNNLQQVFPDTNFKIWDALEKYLIKYNKILQQRKNEANKIIQLQSENDQLRTLLQQYLSSDANKELIIAPSLMIE